MVQKGFDLKSSNLLQNNDKKTGSEEEKSIPSAMKPL